MGFLDQLKSGLSISATPEKAPVIRPTKERNPVVSSLRVWSNGAIYPSASTVKAFNLSYVNRDDAKVGNGFDVIDSRAFFNTKDSQVPFLMIAPVSKDLPKVDFFDSCRYNEFGTPISTVMEQGSTVFGSKVLLSLLREVYNIAPETGGYIDLDIVTDASLQSSLAQATNGIYLIPKTKGRGEDKGVPSYTRRENLSIYVLVPHVLNSPDTADDQS